MIIWRAVPGHALVAIVELQAGPIMHCNSSSGTAMYLFLLQSKVSSSQALFLFKKHTAVFSTTGIAVVQSHVKPSDVMSKALQGCHQIHGSGGIKSGVCVPTMASWESH